MSIDHLIGAGAQTWLAVAQILALLFWRPLAALGQSLLGAETRRATRIEKLEDLIDELRQALDKGRIRENAIAAIAELLIFAINHVENPSPAIVSLRARARDVLELARAHLQDFKGGEQ
jgi:hypothetical protein